jgi:predicted nucleic acid-binding protein
VIGGRVLDASALVAFCSGSSVYAQALVWTAVEEGLVLLVPSTAVAVAVSQLSPEQHDVLDVLLRLPVTVVDDLTATRAIAVGAEDGEPADAHAVLCARDRGWPLLTADATRCRDDIEIEPLP